MKSITKKTSESRAKGLKNPAVAAAVASNPKSVENVTEIVRQTTSVIPFVIKTGIVLGIGYFVLESFQNRFKSWPYVLKWGASSVTEAQAKGKADMIHGAIGTFNDDFETIKASIKGLNYNGFVMVYNAFGHRKAFAIGKEMTMVEMLQDNLDEYELSELKLLMNGQFF